MTTQPDEIAKILNNLEFEAIDDIFDCPGGHKFNKYIKSQAHKAITTMINKARIDEMKSHRHEWEMFGDRPPYKGESVSLPILLAYHDDRIVELSKSIDRGAE